MLPLPPGNPPAIGSESGTIWLPQTLANGAVNQAQTWLQVMSVLQASPSPEHIWTGGAADGPYPIPRGVYDVLGATFEQRYIGPNTNLEAEANTTIDNLRGIIGCRLRMRPTSAGFQSLTSSGLAPGELQVLLTRLGGSIGNFGSVPLVTITSAKAFIFGCFDQSSGFESGSTAPLFHLADAGALAATFCGFASPNTSLPTNLVTGVVGSTFLIVHDGTIGMPIPTFPGMLGSVVNNPVGVMGGTGTTAQRPATGLWPTPDGCMYRDTTLNKAIWWSAADGVWVDANGAGPQ